MARSEAAHPRLAAVRPRARRGRSPPAAARAPPRAKRPSAAIPAARARPVPAGETGDVPRIELAQVARRALLAEVLDRPRDRPIELGQHLLARGVLLAAAHELLEQPGVAERAAREHRGGGPRGTQGRAHAGRVVEAPREDHRRRQRLHELRRQLIVGFALVVHRGGARVKADRGDARLLDEASREPGAAGLARAHTRAQLHGDGQPRRHLRSALDGRPGDCDREAGIVEQSRPGARLLDLRHRAAHVDVDHVGTGVGEPRGGRAHHRRVFAEQLDPHGTPLALARIDAEHLLARPLVAVVHGMRGDHLRDRHPRSVALRLQAHEPVADPRERSEQHAVGDREGAELPRLVQSR